MGMKANKLNNILKQNKMKKETKQIIALLLLCIALCFAGYYIQLPTDRFQKIWQQLPCPPV